MKVTVETILNKTAAIMLLAVPAVASSATYHEVNQPGGISGVELTSAGATGCAYANEPIALGDILTYPDGSRQVCASGDRGQVFMGIWLPLCPRLRNIEDTRVNTGATALAAHRFDRPA
jgi:hypothetical protein